MNEYFIKKISDLKVQNCDGQRERATKILQGFVSTKELPSGGFSLQEINTNQMLKITRGMKGKKSCGLDWICGYSLKIAAPILCEELLFITNLSIRSGKFASSWKYTKVLPAFKNKGSKYDAEFYRPLSNLSEVSKLTERAIHGQVSAFRRLQTVPP